MHLISPRRVAVPSGPAVEDVELSLSSGTMTFTGNTPTLTVPSAAIQPDAVSDLAFWFDPGGSYVFSDSAGTTGASDGGAIQRWNTRAGATGGNVTNTDAAELPTWDADGINGQPCIVMPDASTQLQGTNSNMMPGAVSKTWFAVIETSASTTTLARILNANAWVPMCWSVGASGNVGWFDGSFKSAGSTATGRQILCFVFETGVNTGTVYRNGQLVGSAAWASANNNWSPNQQIWGQGGTAAGGLVGKCADLIGYTAKISDSDRLGVTTWLADKYGITL